jgi:hypothetical protein
MRTFAGFLFVGACVCALWLSGFYGHHTTPSPGVSQVTTTQPGPHASHKAPHLPHVPHMRGLRIARLLGGGYSNGGNGQ